ncbi:cutinase family protein [Nocardia sp. CDC159]|uniref:Cutinase family protein n=1 Tax=Nocardia pulmonis TaxID=2951408 RepID=A0A9X2IY74_9NOCA|nr:MULTISPECIES: cutinase family protein [Nocardia]MCM6774685.1 cutinase family protein [Nocardia pulmonis]MCM6787250.1 cutinase family protein [Nocardia sp. CDC159]
MMLTARTTWSRLGSTAIAMAAITTVVAPHSATAQAPTTNIAVDTCPALYALGIQGTGESSPDAAPTTDTGMLSSVFLPMLAKAPERGLVERAYVPYASGFGGAVGGAAVPYAQSVLGGLDRLRGMAAQLAQRCDRTRFAIVGYSQGAHVASLFAQEIGRGRGVLTPERIAAVALFADPTRNSGAPLFPGAPERTSPAAPPGVPTERLAAVRALPGQTAGGGGIGPGRDQAADFGALTGRVASFCVAGDLACDAPAGAPILRAVAAVAGQSQLSGGDPIASLSSIAQALAFTSIKAASTIVNQDLRGTTSASLSYQPGQSISQRIAEASDPRTRLAVADPMRALLRVGLIGLNAVGVVVRAVLDPATLTQLARAALSDPPKALVLLGSELSGAVTQLVPPTTVSRLIEQAYRAVVQNITDNRALLDTTTWVRYWDTVQRHGAYATAAVDARGDSPVRFVADWFAAMARDLAAAGAAAQPPKGGASSPITGILGPAPGASSSPNTSGTGQFPFGTGLGPSAGTADNNNYPFSTN